MNIFAGQRPGDLADVTVDVDVLALEVPVDHGVLKPVEVVEPLENLPTSVGTGRQGKSRSQISAEGSGFVLVVVTFALGCNSL